MTQRVFIYTDGACLNNPGPGGIGIVLKYGNHVKELSKGFRYTTNNRMELMAVIVALSSLKKEGLEIIITSDSSYVVDAVNKGWLFGWAKNNFKKKKNPDLWKQFLAFYSKHKIQFRWVEGHSGHPENERCDKLASKAALHPSEIDTEFENSDNLSLL